MKKQLLLSLPFLSFAALANTNPHLETYKQSVNQTIYKGQRVNIPVKFNLPADRHHLVTLGYDNNQPNAMDCKIEIYNGANQRLHNLDCRAGWGEHKFATPIVYWQDNYRAVISVYNADFTKPSQRFDGNFRFNYGESTSIDNDHLPTWWKKTYEVVGLDANTDYDGDGFSLIQEYFGNSKPNDATSYPDHDPVIDFDEQISAGTSLYASFGTPVTKWVEITPYNNKKVKSLELVVNTTANARNQSVVAFIYNENNERVYPSYLKYPSGTLSVSFDEPVDVQKLKIELTARHYSSNINARYDAKVNAVFTE
ncbi:hypothetical protein L4174_016140 [Photobacterium sp. CCB-ST2H9]|uniref:hypothetical protein n=1 Tax=Photobacterium sp. CCB-ST2H9 TaxID=2912855 RepID=UPI0020055E6F|nr:hypothetical protein [Photobacterium sp. CCB-ST2H9]UTM57268.1 hypothetical protein L4174_016140 [Photobacterium sp. CCB-ST2H9]